MLHKPRRQYSVLRVGESGVQILAWQVSVQSVLIPFYKSILTTRISLVRGMTSLPHSFKQNVGRWESFPQKGFLHSFRTWWVRPSWRVISGYVLGRCKLFLAIRALDRQVEPAPRGSVPSSVSCATSSCNGNWWTEERKSQFLRT